jgi:gliding motility-associated-like protein
LWHLLLPETVAQQQSSVFFTENNGQWDEKIQYLLRLNSGNFYIEKNGFSVLLWEQESSEEEHENHAPHTHKAINPNCKAHFIKASFVGCNPDVILHKENICTFYSNFFIGNDPAKWRGNVKSYQKIIYKNLYAGIDLQYYGNKDRQIKYDVLVKKGANPSLFKIKYSGAEKIFVKNQTLHIQTGIKTIKELKPYAYQIINDIKTEVPCHFKVDNHTVSFEFPHGYNTQYDLIIDPVLIFSTYSGSSADNFGFTATYDSQKNAYGAGIVYMTGSYPVTPGAFQMGFNGTNNLTRDIAITKFNPNGNGLVYSTYFGGSGTEAPHSLVCNVNDELFVMGTTGSADFPVTATCYDNSFNGGFSVSPFASGMDYTSGSDIFVAHFNAAGNALIGSTYIGGSSNDGLNTAAGLAFNYGDPFRGEIIIDAAGNCIVASTTQSLNFPVTNASQPAFGGGTQDAVIFKMNATLSTLIWCTYFGGNGDDTGYGVQLDGGGNIYMSGGTSSSNLPVTPAVINPVYGGNVDGYIVRFSVITNNIQACTYLGTQQYDQSYFVQIDNNNDVYVVGQTQGNYPISPGVYNNGPSGQFIHKLNNTFTGSIFSTRIGRGINGVVDISPSAFLVNVCGQIYLCGWGGDLNGYYQNQQSSTNGLPLTSDAFQSTTDGSDFYLIILAPNASGLLYATYMGGPLSKEHVDGGTSRFDKDGLVYQAVCAGCGNYDDFPVTPGVWSATNNSFNCNMAVFKFDMNQLTAYANFSINSSVCTFPVTVNFTNTSNGGQSFYWDFGDGNTSTTEHPTHQYQNPGIYNVMLIATDTNTCKGKDTVYLQVIIPTPPDVTANQPPDICIGDTTTLSIIASGGISYSWSPATGLSCTNCPNPSANPAATTTYTVTITDTNGCTASDNVTITVIPNVQAGMNVNFTPCIIPALVSLNNSSTNSVSYYWDFGDGFTSTNTDPQHVYSSPGNYTITLIATDSSTCNISDTVTYNIYLPPPLTITVGGNDTICSNTSTGIFASGASTYQWFPPYSIDNPSSPNPNVSPDVSTVYMVIAVDSNGCVDTGYVNIEVYPPAYIDAGPDLIYDDVGPGVQINAVIPNGTNQYYWTPATGLSCIHCLNPIATPNQSTTYYLFYTDQYGCTYVDSLIVLVTPSVFIPNAFTPNGDDKNPVFKPIVRNLSYYEFYIFNRWGEIIFETRDTEAGWDGTHKNNKCPIDVYVWMIKYADQINPEVINVKRGHVTLIR